MHKDFKKAHKYFKARFLAPLRRCLDPESEWANRIEIHEVKFFAMNTITDSPWYVLIRFTDKKHQVTRFESFIFFGMHEDVHRLHFTKMWYALNDFVNDIEDMERAAARLKERLENEE